MHWAVETFLRAAPAIAIVTSMVLAGGLYATGLPLDGYFALAIAACGMATDLTVFVLKMVIFKPLYSHLKRTTLPILGRGPRPAGAKGCGPWGSGNSKGSYGLPSGHAARTVAMFYLASIVAPAVATPGWTLTRVLLGLLALIVPASRVVLGCHTWSQIGWGAVVGLVVGYGFNRLMPTLRGMLVRGPRSPRKSKSPSPGSMTLTSF